MLSLINRTISLAVCFLLMPLSHVQAEETTRILMFGDSLIAGYGLKAHESLPAQLEQLLNKDGAKYEVINAGVSGDTTAAGRSRLEWTLNKHKPDVVFLALGGNDVLRGIAPTTTKENITAMLDTLAASNIPTILSAAQASPSMGETYQQQFDQIYPDVANAYNVPLYPFVLRYTFGKKDLMLADGVHPSSKGVAVIATPLAEYIQQYVMAMN